MNGRGAFVTLRLLNRAGVKNVASIIIAVCLL